MNELLLVIAAMSSVSQCNTCQYVIEPLSNSNGRSVTTITLIKPSSPNTTLFILSDDRKPVFTATTGRDYRIHGLELGKVYSYSVGEIVDESTGSMYIYDITFIGGKHTTVNLDEHDKVTYNFGIDIKMLSNNGERFTHLGKEVSKDEFLQALKSEPRYPDTNLPYVSVFADPWNWPFDQQQIKELSKLCHFYINDWNDSVMIKRLNVDFDRCKAQRGAVVVQRPVNKDGKTDFTTEYYYGKDYLSYNAIKQLIEGSHPHTIDMNMILIVALCLVAAYILLRNRSHGAAYRTFP
jgi:hypothetical protein